MVVDSIGDVGVVPGSTWEYSRRVVAASAWPSLGLGLQDLTSGDEVGRHAVTQPVQRGVADAGSIADPFEAMP